jgi:transcription antitermination factor NusG
MNALNNASIKDENSKGFASFAFPEAKSSKTGVSVRYTPAQYKQWYVLRIKYGKTQTVADTIIEDGTYVYLAKVWKDVRNKETGKKQRKLLSFMNLLFVYATAQQAEKYVKGSKESEYTTYYYNHFQTDQRGQNPPLTVSSRDMESFIRVTALQDEHVMEVDINKCRFVSDDIVRVTSGPFEGVTGRVARVARQNRVVVYIKGLDTCITTAYIPSHYLEKVKEYSNHEKTL